MAEGVYTEREWRMHRAYRRSDVPACWGAQYVQPIKRQTLQRSKCLYASVLGCTLLVSLLMPICWSKRVQPVAYPMAVVPAAQTQLQVRKVSGITYSMPTGLTFVQTAYTYEELCRGKLLLLDSQHPLPQEAPRLNAVSIATYGKGMVPVHDLALKTGEETIQALTALFADLRANGCSGFTVWQGAVSPNEQRAKVLSAVRKMAVNTSLEEACLATRNTMELPGLSELQQGYTVELRLGREGSSLPDERPLEATAQGRQLLQCAWHNGFVRTQPEAGKGAAFRFRYVGLAHSTAMTYLDADLPYYLSILHEKQVMTVQCEGGKTYVIQCIPVQGERTVFLLPKGATTEVSYDNTGYAVAVSLLGQDGELETKPSNKVLAAQ